MDWNGQITTYLQKTGPPPPAASDVIAMLGSACQSAVENFIGRTLDNVEYTGAFNGNGRRTLFLPHDPVVQIKSVTIGGGSALTIEDPDAPVYPPAVAAIEPTKQGIVLTDGSVFTCGIRNVLVTYVAGLTSLDTSVPPPSLVFAITYWAAQFFRGRDRTGQSSSTINGQITQFSQDIPKDVRDVIFSYRRPLIAC